MKQIDFNLYGPMNMLISNHTRMSDEQTCKQGQQCKIRATVGIYL